MSDQQSIDDGSPRPHEVRHERLLDALRVGIVVHAADTTIVYSNAEASEVLGLTTEQIEGKTAIDPAWTFLRDDGSRMPVEEYPVNRVLTTQAPLQEYVVGVMRPATADCVWVMVRAYPEYGDQGQLEQVVVTFVEITALKNAERALRESEAIFEHFMEHCPIYVFFKDEKLRSLRLSRNFEEMLGRPRSELLGKSMSDLFPSPFSEQIVADDQRIIREGKACTVEEVFNGRFYETTKFPIMVDGAPRYLAGYTIDVTRRKQEEESRAELQHQLLQSQKMESVGRLAGGVAHDFNNMLMGIMGYAELCRDELPSGHPVQAYLDELTRTARRSADLTRQLLAFARKQAVAPEVLDLNTVVAGLLALLRRLIGEHVELKWEPGADLWPVEIDRSQIDQVLVNLCVNARDSIEGSGGVVTISTQNVVLHASDGAVQSGLEPGDHVRLTISDNGCGMERAALAHIFEPFFTTKDVGKGTGLGLATVYGIVSQNRGSVDVQSEQGEGATFNIVLPRCVAETTGEAPATLERTETPGRGETVLLVEDEESLRVTCGHFLRTLGYTPLVAASPAEARQIVANVDGRIDMLLTDVVMPGMSGPELAAVLKTDLPTLGVLYMSGYAADAVRGLGDEGDGVFFLGKPFTRADLASKLRQVHDFMEAAKLR